jgi:hypothetical protein
VDFFRPKNLTASAGLEPAIFGTRGQHSNRYIIEAAVNVLKQLVIEPPIYFGEY